MHFNKIMINLFIYIVVFAIIVFGVGNLSCYLYNNMKQITYESTTISDFTKLDLYFLRLVKTDDIIIKKYGLVDKKDSSSYYITFQKEDGTTNTFIKIGNIIYYDKIKLCENVESFKVMVDKSDKESISIEVKLLDKIYNSQYVLN